MKVRPIILLVILCSSFALAAPSNYAIDRSQSQARFAIRHFAETVEGTFDELSGNILQITAESYKEVSDPLLYRVESGPVQQFPNRIQVARADFDFVTGVGLATGSDPNETDPSVAISWSDDGGVKWSVPLIRKLGRQANARQRVTVLNTGLSGPQGRRWRIDISDPVYVSLIGGEQSADARAA